MGMLPHMKLEAAHFADLSGIDTSVNLGDIMSFESYDILKNGRESLV